MADRRRSGLKIPDRRRFALAPWQCDNPNATAAGAHLNSLLR
jgi:hypothetical protein